jgi:hypothetical protein
VIFARLRFAWATPSLGASLVELAIDLGSIDLRQDLAGGDACPDIDIPLFQVTADAGENGRLQHRLHFGGEHEAVVPLAGFGARQL